MAETPRGLSVILSRARAGDERSDLYALGAVAYFLLTGRPPFDEGNGIGVMMAHARDAVVPPSRDRADVPRELERVVLRCLAKEPCFVRRQDPTFLK